MKDKVIIIAEAGVNHNGDIKTAKRLVEVAADSGADYIKFQTFIAKKNIAVQTKKAEYQIENTGNAEESQLEMVKKLELTPQMHEELFKHCQKSHIKFLSTAFDFQSIQLLSRYHLDLFKIPSGEIVNLPYIEAAARENYPWYVLSTGMANLSDIERALEIFESNGISRKKITILHCNTEYPTPMKDVNLSSMLTIGKAFKTDVGYSDHTLGIEIPIAAAALGARIIEKHFTLDKCMEGPDHEASLNPVELKQMIRAIRNIEKALGNGIKRPSQSEKKNIPIVRKSIVAKKEIKEGSILTEENISIKRAGKGISPMRWYEILGQKAIKDYEPDELIIL